MRFKRQLLNLFFSLRLKTKPTTSLSKLEGEKILLIVSCREKDFVPALEQIINGFPGSLITIVAKQEIINSFKQDQRIKAFILYPHDGYFKINKVGRDYFNEIKSRRFDLVLIIYSNYSGKHCFNVERFGKRCGGKNLAGFYRSGHFFSLEGKAWKINVVRRFVELIWALLENLFFKPVYYMSSFLNLLIRACL